MLGAACSMGMAAILWSMGIDWETNGPTKIISIANKLIQLARALAETWEGARWALRAFIQSMRMLGSIILHGGLLEHLNLDHEIACLGKVQRERKMLPGLQRAAQFEVQ